MAGELEAKAAKADWGTTLKGAVLTSGVGAGAVVMYAMIETIRSEPKLFLQMLTNWGPLFAVVILVAVLGDRRMGELIAVNKSNAEAQTRMADAIAQIADKRDDEAMEQRRLMSYVGSQMEKVLERLDRIGVGAEKNS
jgi:hypothetical protein